MAVKAKKINQLPDGTPDQDSWIPFSNKDGKSFRFPMLEMGGRDFTGAKSAIVARPKQTAAKVQLFGDMTGIGKDLPVRMVLKYNDENGTVFTKLADVEWQGATSLGNPKKSYSIDLLNIDEDEFKIKFGDWVSIDSFHLKSNYSDVLGVRDIGIARIAKLVWETRPQSQAFPWSVSYSRGLPIKKIKDSGARGVIDGFACELYVNGDYQGLYSWNLSRKRQNFNMDKGEVLQIMAGAENFYAFPPSAPWYRADQWDIKNPKFDVTAPQETQDALTRVIQFVQTSTQSDFTANADQYLKIDAVIDYFLIMLVFWCTDNRVKNMNLVTYDGLVWWPCLYDMDRSIGIRHEAPLWGDIVGPEMYSDINDPFWQISLMYVKSLAGFKGRYDARYAELRNKYFNAEFLQPFFSELSSTYPYDLWKDDIDLWGADGNHRILSNVGQVIDFLIGRFALLDPQFNYDPNPQSLLL